MAAAPDLATLFQFEKQIEPAAVLVLGTFAAGVQIVPDRTTETLLTPRWEVKLQMGAPTGHGKPLPGASFSPAQSVPDRFNAQLVVSTVTNRKTVSPPNGARHDELVGKARVAMLLGLQNLNVHLDWLTVVSINSMGVVPTVQQVQDIDTSPEIFAIQFAIRPAAWPALPAAV